MSLAALYSSEDPNWRTPGKLYTRLDSEFHFNVDLAADAENHLAPAWLGPGSEFLEDALVLSHWAELVSDLPTSLMSTRPKRKVAWTTKGFLNPPYSKKKKMPIAPWLERALRTQQHGGLVVGVVPARTDTPWWHSYVMKAREIRFVCGRIDFEPSPEYLAALAALGKKKPSGGNFPSAIVIWDGRGSQTERAPYVCSWKWKFAA